MKNRLKINYWILDLANFCPKYNPGFHSFPTMSPLVPNNVLTPCQRNVSQNAWNIQHNQTERVELCLSYQLSPFSPDIWWNLVRYHAGNRGFNQFLHLKVWWSMDITEVNNLVPSRQNEKLYDRGTFLDISQSECFIVSWHKIRGFSNKLKRKRGTWEEGKGKRVKDWSISLYIVAHDKVLFPELPSMFLWAPNEIFI